MNVAPLVHAAVCRATLSCRTTCGVSLYCSASRLRMWPTSDRRFVRTVLLFGLTLGWLLQGTLRAHAIGENYIFLNFRPDAIDGRFEIHFDDLRRKVGVAIDVKGAEATAALNAAAPRVHDYIRRHFSIGPEGGAPYELEFGSATVLELPQGFFAQYQFRARTGPLPDRLFVRHSMLFEGDRLHRGLVVVNENVKTGIAYGEEAVAMVFGPMAQDQTLDLHAIPHLLGGRAMVWQGVLHIWIGIDHVLFLVALILPTVLVLSGDGWRPVPGFPRALWNLLKIVTVFTVAHSLTLLLAALGILDVPSRLVESIIALSIVLVALNNITGSIREGSLLVVMTLGLFHGLGFAAVMGHLPFRAQDLVKAVLGFNIGVELGQMAIVAALFPVLYLLRTQQLYQRVVLKGGSALLILISGAWFIQRAFGLS